MSRAALLLVVGLVALLAAACATIPGLSTGGGPLLTITTRGGECPDGPCGSVIVIERDGRIHALEPLSVELGVVPADVLAALTAAVAATDFDALRSRPFTGECPVNVDGQEWIYEFGAPGGVERIASCESEIDPDHPLFVAADAASSSADVVSQP